MAFRGRDTERQTIQKVIDTEITHFLFEGRRYQVKDARIKPEGWFLFHRGRRKAARDLTSMYQYFRNLHTQP